MTVNRKKKNLKLRGYRFSGHGHKKRTKGAGHRGGRGLAGTGKRADQRKPSIWKDTSYFGKSGFKRKNKVIITAINLNGLNGLITKFNLGMFKDEISYSNGIYTINLTELGYDKLLGKGNLLHKVKVIVGLMTESAKSKVISD